MTRAARLGRVIVINLDRDEDRLSWIAPQLDKLGIPWSRLAAFTPESVPDHIRARFADAADHVLLPNNIASFASHLAAIETARDADDWTLVLEDDVAIECDAAHLQELVAAAMAANADVVRFATPAKSATTTVATVGSSRVVKYLAVPRGAGAYAIDPVGADAVLARARGLIITTDNFLRDASMRGLRMLGVMPPPIPQDRFGTSSIDPGNERARRRPNYRYDRGGLKARLDQHRSFLSWIGLRELATLVAKQVFGRRG